MSQHQPHKVFSYRLFLLCLTLSNRILAYSEIKCIQIYLYFHVILTIIIATTSIIIMKRDIVIIFIKLKIAYQKSNFNGMNSHNLA